VAIATKILIAEDDPDIAGLMTLYIEREGWHAHPVTTGEAALAYARTQPVDVAVLDIMLPGLDGLELVRLLRAHDTTARLPIIMVTAKADENDRIGGLEIGADDYLTKPFSPKELIARIRALLRRTGRQEPAAALVAGPLTMDLSRHTVSEDGREVTLTAKEFLLLQYFLEHPDRVLSRDLLLTEVWGYRYTGGTRTVDVHIRRLREKLPTLAGTLVTVKQFGYKLVERGSNVD
jgi:DNA-binding response OmpR family regulator